MGRKQLVHRCGQKCVTESRFAPLEWAAPREGVQPEVVVDVSGDRIPLWAPGTTLNWRFDDRSLRRHDDAEAMKRRVRTLFREAIAAWKTAAPVRFQESTRGWDFEIEVRKRSDCDDDGCTLASAFFPSPERQKLLIFPTIFEYDRREQVATLVHELGHIFGLRHFFARTAPDERRFPSLIFGKHSSFTIMNYGSRSRLTAADRRDVARLYEAAWSADAEARIGRQVRLVHAPHSLR